MPKLLANGAAIAYEDHGRGEPVVMVMGTGSPGHVWQLHQVPALVAAGYRVITMDNRGLPGTDGQQGRPAIEDLVGDVAALIERLCGGSARLAGVSMGAHVVQELTLARPDLVVQAVLIATRARMDALREALRQAEAAFYAGHDCLPGGYAAVLRAMQSLSPRTLNDEQAIARWLELFELFPVAGATMRAQRDLEFIPDRRQAYRGIRRPCLVIAFEDDLITPPYLNAEVAEAIPGSEYLVIPGCGHLGYLERPADVNKAIIGFFASGECSPR
jgi:pimeloyl-ACP methyl ester carboxylesterase